MAGGVVDIEGGVNRSAGGHPLFFGEPAVVVIRVIGDAAVFVGLGGELAIGVVCAIGRKFIGSLAAGTLAPAPASGESLTYSTSASFRSPASACDMKVCRPW
jgi:hypothetical protein